MKICEGQNAVIIPPFCIGLSLKESFQWAPDEYIRFLRQTVAGSVYRVRAIHVAKSLNRFAYTEEELRDAGRTLAYRPLDLNHETPLPFPANRVIDSEYEDACVEALIVVADPCIIQLIEAKKIVAVSVEGQYRRADVVCDEYECVWNPHGIALTGLALLTPGVQPGDPLASIVLRKRMETERSHTARAKKLEPASPVITGMTSCEVDTKPNQGGVMMEKKLEATPPLEPAKNEQPAENVTSPPAEVAPPTSRPTVPAPPVELTNDETATLTGTVTIPAPAQPEEPPKTVAEKEPCQEAISKANEEIAELRGQVSALQSQVRLLQERRKGSRGA